MLVITRKIGESIIISCGNDKIEIIISDIHNKDARIGILANEKFSILRKELMDKKNSFLKIEDIVNTRELRSSTKKMK